MSEAKERSAVCNRLAFECYKVLEPKFDEIVNQLENNIEINHFLACLNNRLAISIAMKFNVKENPLNHAKKT